MTRTAARVTTLVVAALAALAFLLAMLAQPAAATEGEESTGEEESHATEEDSGFGSGLWDGMILSAGAGLVVGLMVFGMSEPGGIPRADAH